MKIVLYREKEVSKFLGVSKKTLQAWRFRGRGPAYRKIGRLCLYEEGDIEAFVNISRRTSTSDKGAADKKGSPKSRPSLRSEGETEISPLMGIDLLESELRKKEFEFGLLRKAIEKLKKEEPPGR